ncbi:DUF1353 domain-containing protein [Burkholderia ubonensis]|uniref:DUF1353 domain-containing protein n=1 Tax=Burkholderia ubonensis TaxID=101571 RepID=UPI0007C65294|nr:DUF1353 domain-containing protein [Burkholderia ubonensis]
MSCFLTRLRVEPATAKDDGNWRLLAPLIYQSDAAEQTFTVPTGFVTNFASVPRIPVIYELAGNTSSEAATVHDYLYTTHIVARDVADAVLREASAVTAVPWWRRQLMWAGVRVFGWTHWGTAATDPSSSENKAAVQPVPEAFSTDSRH